MNQDQVAGILRIAVTGVCTWLAAKGFSAFGDEGVIAQISAAVVAVALAAWSFYSHTDTSKLNAVAAMPEVQKIVVKPSNPNTAAGEAAADTTKPKVVEM